jgi:AraC family transcriptional regulator
MYVQAHTISRTLFANERLLVGEFWCSPDSPRWHSLNNVSAAPHVIFPRTPVTIRQLGRDPVIGDRNQILFYNPGQRYFRSPTSQHGDHCYYVELSSELMARLAGGMKSFPFAFGPCDASIFLLQRLAVRHVAEPGRDPQLVGEAMTLALENAIAGARSFHEVRVRKREVTRAAHREIVNQTKQLLIARFREHLTMAEIAESLGISRFQLSRVFRAWTGFSLLGYRNQLRLRTALDRLAAPGTQLPALAKDLGFSSHSHFTAAFRESFGLLPSDVRGPIRRELLNAVVARHMATTNVPLLAASGCNRPA